MTTWPPNDRSAEVAACRGFLGEGFIVPIQSTSTATSPSPWCPDSGRIACPLPVVRLANGGRSAGRKTSKLARCGGGPFPARKTKIPRLSVLDRVCRPGVAVHWPDSCPPAQGSGSSEQEYYPTVMPKIITAADLSQFLEGSLGLAAAVAQIGRAHV